MLYSIVDEQPWFLLIHKHPGAVVHGTADSGEVTLTQALRHDFNCNSLFPCHRLDRTTSGLLVVAKGEAANKHFSTLFEKRAIDKCYLALSAKKPAKKQGAVRGDMVKARNGSWMLTRSLNAPAHTQFFSKGGVEGKRLFVLRPLTGKTHQLRVAMKSLGAPILGDERYGGGDADRCYLHAFALQFSLDGRQYSYLCPPEHGDLFCSQSFKSALDDLQSPFELPWPAGKRGQ
ncbi:pseudouridine synthase [Teredinibacter turnerae]|uniref:pseudouridine synthase n=1 Tax=Teredinibacter turnerae TaxID=2426 RepID=UPI0003660319|nr:pseudouridine synthase [Teredinibacter turnerae]